MNFLAHLYLTQNQAEKVVVGNFIADAVKGKKALKNYEAELQLGIRIHREIDEFTDRHPIFKKGTKRLRPKYGKFSGIIMDICYDHILASNWMQYSDIPLQKFADDQYDLIEKHWVEIPQRTRMWFYYMKKHNLLFNYSKEASIAFVLQGMDNRTGKISGMSTAIQEIRSHKDAFTAEFNVFFADIQSHLSVNGFLKQP